MFGTYTKSGSYNEQDNEDNDNVYDNPFIQKNTLESLTLQKHKSMRHE